MENENKHDDSMDMILSGDAQMEITEKDQAAIEELGIEDTSLMKPLALPTYDDVNEQKVLKSVRDLFKGVDYDPTAKLDNVFRAPADIAKFIVEVQHTIREKEATARGNAALSHAAGMARMWFMADYVRRALDSGKHGQGAYLQVAKELGKSQSLVYQLKNVSKALTAVDCYLLGMRGISSTTLRLLAQKVKDDDQRKAMIKAFIDALPASVDESVMERERRKFRAAINSQAKADFESASATDPSAGGSGYEVSPEYDDLKAQLDLWTRLLSKPAKDDLCDQICMAAGNFYLSEVTPEAQRHLDDMKADIGAFKALIKCVQNNLDDIMKELTSVEASTVIPSEGDDASAKR